MTKIGDALSLALGLSGSRVFRIEGDSGCQVAEFLGMKYLRDRERTSGGSGVAEAAGWIE